MGFGQGLSGLNAASQTLDVIGNNIANSGTVGFKSSTATFADVYASSRVGLGVQVASINQRFTIGTISGTGNQFDMAIDGARGMFRVEDQSGNVLYTRNGQFFENKEHYIVNAQGHHLTGYVDGSTTPTRIKVPVGNIAPVATTGVTTKANFDANAPLAGGEVLEDLAATPPVAAVGPIPFDPAVAASFTHTLNMDVYDSLGNAHLFTQYFAKRPADAVTGESVWDVYYRLDGDPVAAPPVSHELRFSKDDAGRLVPSTALVDVTVTNVGAATSPAKDLELSLDYSNSTQFGGPFSPDFNATGYATGEYTSMSIAADGSIVASYTNGKTDPVGTLVLAHFNNLQGLQPSGGNAWRETSTSGQPILGTPGSNSMATIKGQAVEESNVDMSQELVNMIIAQRTYQANAQTIKTQDQVLQTLINLR